MKTITYTNSAGMELVLTNSAPFLLQSFEETESVNIYNLKGTNQDGLTYLGNTLDLKDIVLEFTIIAKSEVELIKYRDRINQVINPKLGEGYLTYKDDAKERKIKCIVNAIPFFKVVKYSEGCVATGIISLTANNPYWTDLLETRQDVAVWRGAFEFPLEILEEGIEVGFREPRLIVNIINKGNVECGMRIVFRALASVVNPSISNVRTQEFIKVAKTMAAGESLIITTYFGDKRVESFLDGITTNAFNYIDLGSTFLQLMVGDNLIRYDADVGLDNLEVNVYYHPRYLGV